MTLTKADLADSLCSKYAMNRQDARELVDQLFEEIRCTLEAEDCMKISGFGNFNVNDKNARPGRNPRTGEDVAIGARRVVTFKAGLKLKETIDSQVDKLLDSFILNKRG